MASSYKSFLRLCEKWPLDKSKQGRDLGEFIRERVAKVFKHGEMTKVDEAECKRIYESLNRIADNYYYNKYQRDVKRLSDTSMGLTRDQCKVIVSTEGLKELEKANVPFWRTLFKRN